MTSAWTKPPGVGSSERRRVRRPALRKISTVLCAELSSRVVEDELGCGRHGPRGSYALKPAFQSWLRPMVARLAAAGVTANEVTVTAMVGSCLVGAVALVTESRAAFLAIPTWLVLRMALNAIDGMLAREHGQRSRLGACLNEIGDVVSDAALYAPFAALPALGTGPVALVIGLALLSEFAGVLGPMIGASRRYDGPLGKSDRALLAGAFAAWIGFGGAVASWAAVGLWLVVPLLGFTAVNRVRGALSETGSTPAAPSLP